MMICINIKANYHKIKLKVPVTGQLSILEFQFYNRFSFRFCFLLDNYDFTFGAVTYCVQHTGNSNSNTILTYLKQKLKKTKLILVSKLNVVKCAGVYKVAEIY